MRWWHWRGLVPCGGGGTVPERPSLWTPLGAAATQASEGPWGAVARTSPWGLLCELRGGPGGGGIAVANNHEGGGTGFGEGTRKAAAGVEEPLGGGGGSQGLHKRVGWGKATGFRERAWVSIGLGSMWE